MAIETGQVIAGCVRRGGPTLLRCATAVLLLVGCAPQSDRVNERGAATEPRESTRPDAAATTRPEAAKTGPEVVYDVNAPKPVPPRDFLERSAQ